MPTIVAAIDRDPHDAERAAAQVARALRHVTPKGERTVSCFGAILGMAPLLADSHRGQQPFVDVAASVSVVVDGRLHNRSELAARLGLSRDCSDASVIAAGYGVWAEDLPRQLRGDFAVVLWDWGRKRVLAFKDQLGVKPLFYAIAGRRAYFASHVDVLHILSGARFDPDDRAVIEHLLWQYALPGITCWTGLARLPAGHVLSISATGSTNLRRYWYPTVHVSGYANLGEVHEDFKERFLRSVERRLESASPVLVHLSGGLDSSSIVCACKAATGPNASTVRTVTQRFADTGWDEGEFVQAVVHWTGLQNIQWDGRNGMFGALNATPLAGPGSGVSRNSASAGDLEIAQATGSETIISGEGGDHIGTPVGLAEDNLRRRGIRHVIEPILLNGGQRPELLRRSRAFIRAAIPTTVRRSLDRRRNRAALPSWLNSEWREMAIHLLEPPTDPVVRQFRFSVQAAHWRELTSARLGTALDLQQRNGRRYGVEFRFPFLDSELVECVLSIPPQYWPSDGVGARLHRDALADLLPPEIRHRRSKTIFSGAIAAVLIRAGQELDSLFFGKLWCSTRYVVRSEAQRLLVRARASGMESQSIGLWRQVRAIATLESWLRTILGYSSAPWTQQA